MRYDEALAARLDHKYGTVTRALWEAVGRKPLDAITADDLDIVELFEGTVGRLRLAKRIAAHREVHEAAIIRKYVPTTSPSVEELERAMETMLDVIKTVKDDLLARIETLETRTLKEAGIHRAGTAYTAGDVVTHRGSCWVCTRAHTAGEAFDHGCFRMLMKGRS